MKRFWIEIKMEPRDMENYKCHSTQNSREDNLREKIKERASSTKEANDTNKYWHEMKKNNHNSLNEKEVSNFR